PRYGKYIRQKTICYVHDENDESHLGDLVEIIESRRRSKTKRWELVRILDKNTAVDLAAMQAQSAIDESEVLENEVATEKTPETESETTVAPDDGENATDGAKASE
ncbi:MAG: uS17 family ribosomal protein, partial [Pirellulaceae bacterium]